MGNDCCYPGNSAPHTSTFGEDAHRSPEDTDTVVNVRGTTHEPSLQTVPELSTLEPSETPRNAGQRKIKFGLTLDNDVDAESSVSATWIMDPSGSMMHQATGVRISPEVGISTPDREYKLSADQIELDEGSKLGAGAGGQVRMGRIKKTGEFVAVKCVKVDDKAKRSMMLSEIKTLIECEKCESLVDWYGGFVSKSGSVVHLVLELMDLGSLRDLLNKLPKGSGESDSATVGMPPRHLACVNVQVFKGLAFLHDRHLLHRDVKPENILHSKNGSVKLTDFGISKSLGCETQAFEIGRAHV